MEISELRRKLEKNKQLLWEVKQLISWLDRHYKSQISTLRAMQKHLQNSQNRTELYYVI